MGEFKVVRADDVDDLYDPDPAVLRAHLVAEFATMVDGTLADGQIGYVYTDQPVETPYARAATAFLARSVQTRRVRVGAAEA
jgi:hypothetical protein